MIDQEILKRLPICKQWIDWLYDTHNENLARHFFHTGMSSEQRSAAHLLTDGNRLMPEYLAPEETGRLAGNPDHRSDIYRLGVVLYELVSGKPPFYGSDPIRVIWMHISQKPADLHALDRNIPAGISSLILKMLTKDPRDRYQSMHGIREDWQTATLLAEKGESEAVFELGSADMSLKFIFTDNIFANEETIRNIHRFHIGEGSEKNRRCIFISGTEGQGKTFLLNKLHNEKIIDNEVSLMASFIDDDKLPYHTLRALINQLYHVVQTLPEEETRKIHSSIEINTGENIGLLPAFSADWGRSFTRQLTGPSLDVQESQNRLAYTLANVIAAVADHKMIWLWLDDLEMATAESLHLIRLVLEESRLKHVRLTAVINETGSQPLQKFMGHLEHANDMETIHLSCSTATDGSITQLLKQLSLPEKQIPQVRALLQKKTGGHPGAMKQLLENAASAGSLQPSIATMEWTADLEHLETMDMADNMITTLMEVYNRLGQKHMKILQCATILGREFDPSLLLSANHLFDMESIDACLSDVLRTGLIQPGNGGQTYVFSNFKLFEAIRKTVHAEESPDIVQGIVEFMYRKELYKKSDRAFYDLVNQVVTLNKRQQEPYHDLLHAAAQKAESIGAFEAAFKFYQSLLPENDADIHKLSIHCKAMEMQLYALNFDYYETYDGLLRLQAKTPIDIAALDLMSCKASLIKQDMKGTVAIAVEALAKLGIRLSPEPSLLRIISVMIKLKWIMRNKTPEAIEQMSVSKDERWMYIIQILHVSSSAIFLAAPKMLPEISAVRIPLTFRYGLSKHIGSAFSTYGFMLSTFSNDFTGMENMMRLAENLNMRFENYKDAASSRFMYFGLCRHWTAGIPENAKELHKNYQFSRDLGEVSMAFFSLATADVLNTVSGITLPSHERDLKDHFAAAIDKKQWMMAELINICIAFREEQSQPTEIKKVLELPQFSFTEKVRHFAEQKKHTHTSVLYCVYGLSHLINQRPGHFESNLPWLLDHIRETGLSSVSTLLSIVFDAINCQYSDSGDEKLISKARKSLKTWAGISPENFAHWLHLSDAIYERKKGNTGHAIFAAEKCFTSAAKVNNTVAQALALEEMLLVTEQGRSGSPESHTHIIKEIFAQYAKWGANAKLASLRKKFTDVAGTSEEKFLNVNSIDLESVMRASNSIAGEVHWERLLEKLSAILIENSGARRVMIFVPTPSGLIEVAQKTDDEPVVSLHTPLDPYKHPESLVTTAAQSGELILIDDLNDHHLVKKNEYFKKNPVLSLLCLPVVRHKELSAVIYLENNVVRGAFNNRVAFIKLLSGQISISIENAQLYHDMEDRIADRTKKLQEQHDKIENQNKKLADTLSRLRETQNQLIHTEKMASLGELTAGIAHEIQNPLNFINNFSDMSRELLDELMQTQPKVSADDAEILLSMISQNLEKISGHGKKADGIVKNMLQHSRKSSGIKEQIQLNRFCKEFYTLTQHGYTGKQGLVTVQLEENYDERIGEVNLEPQDMGRVLVNLISNALYAVTEYKKIAGPDYLPKISISTTALPDAKVRISISDNGPGIPPDILEKIFQPFFTTKPTGQGTGLGLSLSFDIVTKGHNGSLYAHTKKGEGATFVIEIPK
jgi:hypothetical protein